MKKLSKILIFVFAITLAFAVFGCANLERHSTSQSSTSSIISSSQEESKNSSLVSSETSSEQSSSSSQNSSSSLQEYLINIQDDIVGGQVFASLQRACYGTIISLTNTASVGYDFVEYVVKQGETIIPTEQGEFTMPNGEVTITAIFTKQTYAVNIIVNNGAFGNVDKTSLVVEYGTQVVVDNASLTIGQETITATPTAQTEQYEYVFDSWTGVSETIVGETTITANFVKNLRTYTVTIIQPTGGSIKIDNSITETRELKYGTEITLSNSASAGYLFSSYKVNGETQTENVVVITKETTISGTFNKGIAGLTSFSFGSKSNYNASATGSVTINGNSASCSQSYYPSVTSWVRGNFYYETEVALYSDRIYNSDLYCKTGIVISSAQNIIFAPIDAYVNGVNNAGFGSKTELIYAVGRGTLNNGINWSFFGNADYKGNFGKTYENSSTYIKLGVMRIDGVYKFFANDKFMFSVWQPDATSSIQVGILSLNLGFEAKNTKIGYGESVLNNANAYYGLSNSLNPTTRTIDGKVDGRAVNDSGTVVDYSWEENLVNSYGVGDYTRYTYSSAFKGEDGVYVATRSRTKNYRTTYTNVWENTNVEIRGKSGTNAQIRVFFAANGVCGTADNNGTMLSSSGFKQGWTKYQDADGYYVITLEGFIPYSAFGGNVNASSVIKMTFAFRSEETGLNMQDGTDGVYWCGFGSPSLEVTASGLNMEKETTPTEKNIKTGLDGADPFVLPYNNKYYAYGTNATPGYKVSVSGDLKTWRKPTEQDFLDVGITSPNQEMLEGYAFHKDWSKPVYYSKSGSTITCKNLWAPEVAYNPNTKKFVMTYSGYMAGDLAVVSVATSDSPLGPFIDVYNGEKGFLAPTGDANKASIDASIFVDTNGKAYLYYCNDCTRNGIDNFKGTGKYWGVSEIWVVELDSTWTRTVGSHTKCTTPTQDWETQNDSRAPNTAWNEGPYVYKHNGVYYMTYSANPYWNEYYGVGLAFAKSPTGPWTKYHANPIVSKVAGKSVATGHNMFFKDFNGKLWCAYHTYSDPNSTTNGGRELLLSRAWFDNGILRVEYHNW